MKAKLLWLFIFSFVFCTNSLLAQQTENKPQGPVYTGYPTKIEHVPSIASRANLVRPEFKMEEMKDGRSRPSRKEVTPGKGSQGDDALSTFQKNAQQIPGRMPSLVFETGASGSQPTDPAGAVGPNHYFSVINTAFQIFDKSGNSLTGGLVSPNPTIFPSGGCCDLTASYDNAADRWVITMLGAGAQVAVSTGPDPVNDGWTVYTYGAVIDYQKLSVWGDGYYMTDNASGTFHVFERSEMLAGNPGAQMVSFSVPSWQDPTGGFDSPQFFNLSHNATVSGPATMVYYADNAYTSVSQDDHFKLWDVTMDWVTTGNSTVTGPIRLGVDGGGNADGSVTDFRSVFDAGSFINLTQPSGGPDLDAIQATVMNQAQFRKFGTHNSALFNFTVDVDGSATEQAGVRWYELRQSGDGQPWTIHQEGTYVAPDNRHAWLASMIMDIQGNIGMGYTSMSSANSADPNIRVGSYYTGQMLISSGTGIMDVAEEVIFAGDANIPGTRYGDYSKIDIDPDGDKQFWFVNEVMSGGRKNIAGVFQLAPNTADDVGVVSVDTPTDGALSNSETVTVTVFNFGDNAASGFDVTYQVDGGTTITEAFAGSLASQTSGQHVFGTTADLSTEGQTYSIMSCTTLGIDEDTANDCTTTDVIHVFANDIGVTEITAPVSGEGLGNETVSIIIENFGTSAQSGFDVNYIVDGGTPVVETVAATVNPGATLVYNFVAAANLSTVGTFAITSSTLLSGDSDPTNDTAATSVTNVACQTQSNSNVQAIGPNGGTVTTSIVNFSDDFVIDDVNVTIDITHTWDGDLTITLTSPDNVTVVLANQIGGSGDNYAGTVFDDEAGTAIGAGSPPYNGTFQPQGFLSDFDGLQTMGDWTLTITDNANGDAGNLNNWDLQLCGNTNLSVDEALVEEGITVIYEENNQFLVKLPTNIINERLHMNVFNVLGQNLMWRTLENENGQGYEHRIDMSHVSAGIYFVKIGNGTRSNIKRIIVK